MSSLPDGGRHREAEALPLSGMARSKAGYSGVLQKMGARTSMKEWKWQRGLVALPLSGSQRNRGHFSVTKWSPRSIEAGVCKWRASGAMWPPTALCKERLASEEHVVGQWYSWTTMKRCALAWDVWLSGGSTRGPAHHQEGGADGFLLPFFKRVIGPVRIHVDKKGIIDGLRKRRK